MNLLIASSAVLATAEGRFQIGFCPFVPKVPDFDYERFAGTWYEIFRDKGHHAISNQQCTEDTYKATRKGKSMKLKRKYKKKFFHWDIFWNFFENIGDQWNWETIYNPWLFNKEDADRINHSRWWSFSKSLLDYNEHYVISTDYDNYAVVYGCDQYGLFKISYATLLSRTTFADWSAVTEAKRALNEIDYPYQKLWVNAGEKCGWGAAITLDEQILNNVFSQPPNWGDYKDGPNTGRFKELFNPEAKTDIMTGFIGDTNYYSKKIKERQQYLTYGDMQVPHAFSLTLIAEGINYQELLHLKNVQYLHNVPNTFAEIWILTQLDNDRKLEALREIARNPDEIYCCYEQGGGFRNKGYLKEMLTGYARVIIHSKEYGIEKIMEGKFYNGDLTGLGRSHAMEMSIPHPYYNTEQHYTGYFPEPGKTTVGNGFAITDRSKVVQGNFKQIKGFPNEGADLVDPKSRIEPYDVYTFMYPDMPLEDKNGKIFGS